MTHGNWSVTHGENFVAISHTYNGRPTYLNVGDSYSVVMPTESTEALIAELQRHLQVVKDSNR